MNEQLHTVSESFPGFVPEFILAGLLLAIIVAGLFRAGLPFLAGISIIGLLATFAMTLRQGPEANIALFGGMLRVDGVSVYLKLLMDLAGILACILSFRQPREYRSEYFALLVAVVLGGHLLVMSNNFLMIFLSLELISISSFVLAGYSFTKQSSEGSLKYFLFGATASAVMLYGFSLLYGLTGYVAFTGTEFMNAMMAADPAMIFLAAFMILAGFLYKITAAPMHPWAPDVYEAAPMPVIAFLSVAPKVAGLGVLLKFVLVINQFGQSAYDWQAILCVVAILTLTIGNFSALRQQNAKRLMAYSSIAQSGFLLTGIAAFLPQGIHFMLFYASVYLMVNFLVFLYLDFFERNGIHTISGFQGSGKVFTIHNIFLLIGLVALTGLPPTAGFTAKLFVFSALWQSYELAGKPIVLWLMIFGLLNTVISLFYYLRIPYFAFLKSGEPAEKQNIVTFENLLGLVLVLGILIFFFLPGVLMGWINKINFVL